jgi:hypothetical protein
MSSGGNSCDFAVESGGGDWRTNAHSARAAAA